MKGNWTSATVHLLIQFYKEKENLWNPTNKFYRIRSVREQSLAEIAEKLDTTIEEIDRKIHDLRCQYRNERRKESITMSGRVGNGYYNSKWEYYESLHFLYKDKINNETVYIMDSGVLSVPEGDVSFEVEPLLHAMEPVVHSIKRSPQPKEPVIRPMESVVHPKDTVLYPMESVVHRAEHFHSMEQVVQSNKPVFGLIDSDVHPSEHVAHSMEQVVYPKEEIVYRRKPVPYHMDSCDHPVSVSSPNKRRKREIAEEDTPSKNRKMSENSKDDHQHFADYIAAELRRYPERYSNLLKIRLQEAMLRTQIEFTKATYDASEEMIVCVE